MEQAEESQRLLDQIHCLQELVHHKHLLIAQEVLNVRGGEPLTRTHTHTHTHTHIHTHTDLFLTLSLIHSLTHSHTPSLFRLTVSVHSLCSC